MNPPVPAQYADHDDVAVSITGRIKDVAVRAERVPTHVARQLELRYELALFECRRANRRHDHGGRRLLVQKPLTVARQQTIGRHESANRGVETKRRRLDSDAPGNRAETATRVRSAAVTRSRASG